MTTNIVKSNRDAFRHSSRQLIRELGLFRSHYVDTGVTSAQAHILIELGRRKSMNLNEILEEVQMDKSTASRIMQRMWQSGLIKKVTHEGDRRERYFKLSRSGKIKLEQIDKVSVETIEGAFSSLEKNECEQIQLSVSKYALALQRARIRREFPIRQLKPSDNLAMAKVIRRILKDEFQENKKEVDIMLPELGNLYKFYNGSFSQYFVVSRNNKVIGGAGIAPLKGVNGICELQKMYIAKDSRGKGLGELLIQECVKFAKVKGYKGCYLDTREEMKAARSLYEKYGFRRLAKPLAETGHHICDCYYYLAFSPSS